MAGKDHGVSQFQFAKQLSEFLRFPAADADKPALGDAAPYALGRAKEDIVTFFSN